MSEEFSKDIKKKGSDIELNYKFSKYTNLTNTEKIVLESGFRKYGEDGVAMVKRYVLTSQDDVNTQFFRYLYQRGIQEGKNYFKYTPGLPKQDGKILTQDEADEENAKLASDYLSPGHFHRLTQKVLLYYLLGSSLSLSILLGAAVFFK